MPEEMEVGIERLQETIEERRKEVAGERGRGNRHWLDYLAISTALFAVLAAAASLMAGDKANEALYLANQAVFAQTRAVDAWSEYQSDSVKKYQQLTLATILPHIGGTVAEVDAAKAEAARRQKQEDALKDEAGKITEETKKLNTEASESLRHHQRFAVAVTLFQVAIGLSAIAALLQHRLLWGASLIVGAVALLALIDGFTLTI
ncbi:MAG: hypothetical protein NVS4B8_09880 [Herpetosiphon sp.]